MKRDQQEVMPSVTPVKAAVNGSVTIVDLDDVADEPFVQSDAKRKKTPSRASTKKQKVSSAVSVKQSGRKNVSDAVQSSERGDDEESGLLGNASDEGAAPEEEVEREELDKDDVDCCFIESSRIPTHVAKKDYPHRYPEVCVHASLTSEEQPWSCYCGIRLGELSAVCAYCVWCTGCRLVRSRNRRKTGIIPNAINCSSCFLAPLRISAILSFNCTL